MKNPKVGERVAVYGNFKWNPKTHAEIFLRGKRGTITEIVCGESEITVTVPGLGSAEVHPKQCRRLKKKERRRVWINREDLTRSFTWPHYIGCPNVTVTDPDNDSAWIEFVEVRKK